MSRLVIDIETNDLLANMLDFSTLPYKLKDDARLWCIVVRDVDTDKTTVLESSTGLTITKQQLQDALAGCTEIIGHNGIKFDFITLKLFGLLDYEVGYLGKPDKLFGNEVKITDTLVRSRLFNPDRYGGHSLDVWGKRLGEFKDDFRQQSVEAGLIKRNDPKGTEFRQYSELMVDYCITPDMRLLGQDMQWKPAKDFGVGDIVLGFDEYAVDGRKGRRYKDAKIEIVTQTEAEVFEVTLESGKVLKVTGEHRFLVARDNHGANTYDWVETKDLRSKEDSPKYYSSLPCLLPIYEQEQSFDAGWVSGMFDGEGCLTKGVGRPQQLTIAQRPTKTLEKLEDLLETFGVNFSKRYTKKTSDCVTLKVLGGSSEVYRTLMLLRHERLVSKVDFNTFGRLELRGRSYNDGVVSVKSVGVQTILKIQTSARTFMCEGYPMHNCIQDTLVTKLVYLNLETEWLAYSKWERAEKLENKLADLAIRRESYGFWFDKDLAVNCVVDLTEKMQELSDKVNPLLPPKQMNKGTLKSFTPPKVQLKQDGNPSAHMLAFAKKHGAEIDGDLFIYNGYARKMPFTDPIETHEVATIDDLDHVKMYLIELGWNPTEFKVRDLTKDSKKQSISYEKRVKAMDNWLDQTFDEGKYKYHRLKELDLGSSKEQVRKKLLKDLEGDRPVRVPTSPSVRVGVEKELCPNLVALGDKVAFANDFSLYLTYRHRKSSIAGGDIEDMDLDDEVPNTGFLAMYREVDGRIPTPAIEIGASTNRYRHIGVCNVARASSIYGKEMRSLFGCGKGMVQLGFDFSSLEARIQGHYCLPFDGAELAEQLLAAKPNDIHSVNARKLGIPRDQAKSVSYMLMYGGSASKAKTMLGITQQQAEVLVQNYWDAVKPLSDLRDAVEKVWKARGSAFVVGVDGRKIVTRSKHSLLNALFQSGGVICAKYSTVFIYQLLEEQGYKCNPFEHEVIDMCGMIEYHDECQLAVNPKLCQFKVFDTEEEAETFTKEWTGDQLSSIVEGKNGKFVVTLPNPVSKAIHKAIDMAVEEVKLNVELGYEWTVGLTWRQCH